MDELLQLLIQFMGQVEANFDQLDEAEAEEISNFLVETFSILERTQKEKAQAVSASTATPPGVELLWILSGEQPNAFVDYLRTYPGDGLRELANNPARLAQIIQKLQSENSAEQPQVDTLGIQDTQFPSSNVAGMKYDPKSGKLLVKFHGDNGEPIYQYEGVPPQIFQLLQHGNAFAKTRGKNKWGEWWPMKNPSIGAALNQWIKKAGYPYQRLS